MRLTTLSILAVAVVSGCATLGTEITKGNNRIQMSGYSFIVPPDRSWHLQTADNNNSAILTKQAGPIVWRLSTFRNSVKHSALIAATAKEVADDFRSREVEIMIKEGVAKGKYDLGHVNMGEEVVGGKRFYTMEFVAQSGSLIQAGTMYLYFPLPAKNQHFFVAHYNIVTPRNIVAKSFKEEMLSVLASLNFE